MRKPSFLVLAALMVGIGTAGAQLSQTYRDWPSGPEGFLLTQAEARAFQALNSDVKAQEFIDLFWARRDPDLKSLDNEFKLNFEYRVEYADEHFGTAGMRGALSDRGKVLILFGFPSEAGTGRGEFGPARARRQANIQMWTYQGDDLPKGFRGDKLEFVFAEYSEGSNEFRLENVSRPAARAIEVQAANLLLHPELTELPKVGIVSGSEAATSEELAVFAADPRPWPEGARALAVQGLRSEVTHPLWLFVEMPAEVPAAARVIGRVRPVNPGPEVRTFAVNVSSISVPGGRGYELNIPVGTGEWHLDIALLGTAGPLGVTTVDGVVESVPRQGVYISPWYWGAEARQDPASTPGDPFNLGGWHVIPRLSDTFSNKESLTYFCFVVRPTIPEGQQPEFTLSTAVYLGERKLIEQEGQPASLSRVGENVWMFGHSLPLSFLRRPETYTIELTLKDNRSDAGRTTRIPVIIPGE